MNDRSATPGTSTTTVTPAAQGPASAAPPDAAPPDPAGLLGDRPVRTWWGHPPEWWAPRLVVLVVVLLFGLPQLLGAVRADALGGTTLFGVDIGGLSGDALVAEVERIARARGEEPLRVEHDGVAGRTSEAPPALEFTDAEAGYVLDVPATVEAVSRRGRQLNPFAALTDHLRSVLGGIAVTPVQGLDEQRFTGWSEGVIDELTLAPIEGTVTFSAEGAEAVDPEPGVEVDVDAFTAAAASVILDADASVVEAPVTAVAPETTAEEVAAVLAVAESAMDGPIRLERGEGAIVLEPAELAEVFDVARDGGALELTASAAELDARVDPSRRSSVEQDPANAPIRLEGGEITIGDHVDGVRFDAELAAAQLLAIAAEDGPRTRELDARVEAPARTRQDAEALGIVEEVASFTTNFQPGQSRVTNIELIAEMVDGVVLAPGEEFSVNEHVGPRTEEKGFVPGGAIVQGEFVDEIGGGVSQFATTLYNAAYFGGYDIPAFRPHSYYISRYPAGREATLNYDSIDLRIRNNSPYGMLIAATTTASSVTVAIWGTTWVEVESIDSDRTNIVAGEVRDGFDITVTRVRTYPDGTVDREEITTRYLPEDEPEGDEDEDDSAENDDD